MEKLWKAKKKPKMLLRQTLHKAKTFLHKTSQNLKSLIFLGFQKFPKIPIANPFLAASRKNSNPKMQDQFDEFFKGFSENRKSNLLDLQNRSQDGKNRVLQETEEKMEGKVIEKTEGEDFFCDQIQIQNDNGGGQSLAENMKEFEMFDQVDGVDHILDIEEVMHYYSRLTCPIYVEMVDKFFMDMYSEFSIPKPS